MNKRSPDTALQDNRASRTYTELVLEVFRLNGRLLTAGDRLVKGINLTSAHWQVMGAIRNDKATVSDIARAMGLQRQSVQRTVNVLCSEGLVSLVENPNHRRAKLVVMTPKGWATIRKANELRIAWARKTSEGISAAELELACEVLRRIRHRLGDRTLP
ncbi:MAG: MarR family winged helix-turn-helix transcriptional regulator [Rhodospirillales bacterium]